jgi:hypothetical protein
VILPSLSKGIVAWAISLFSSSSALKYIVSFRLIFPFTTFLYGVSIKPRLLTLA